MFIFYENYLEYYEKRIKNVLKEIDYRIVCEETIDAKSLSEMLCIPPSEIRNFSSKKELKSYEVMKILKNSSSYLSKMLTRELEINSEGLYTKDQISYIYNIENDILNSIFEELGLNKVSEEDFPRIFSKVRFI